MIKETAVYIVYHDLSTEARSYEMLCALEMTFEKVICVCRRPPVIDRQCEVYYPKSNKYIEFLNISKDIIKATSPKILVLHDEFTAPLISLGRNKYNSFIIFDSSELNYKRVLPGWKNKLAKVFYYIEARNISKANLIFAANIERLNIMRERYGIESQMEVFDNIHRIDDVYDESACANKYSSYLKQYKYLLVYGGGVSKGRFTFEIAKSFSEVENVGILIIGTASEAAKKEFEAFLTTHNISNVHYLGFVPRAEFKYLLSNAFASFVLFKSDCPNTENCASGKMYESLFLGTPIICSDNPPLKRICTEYGVGESSLDFVGAFCKIKAGYEKYVDNINKYISSLNYDERIINLSKTINMSYENYIHNIGE